MWQANEVTYVYKMFNGVSMKPCGKVGKYKHVHC